MYLFDSRVEQLHHIVLQLRAAHDAVVHKENLLSCGKFAVGQQLHFGHQVAHLLVLGHKTTGPGGGIFHKRTLVGDALLVGVADGVTYTRVGDSSHKVGLNILVTTCHSGTALIAAILHVDTLIPSRGVAIIYPKE